MDLDLDLAVEFKASRKVDERDLKGLHALTEAHIDGRCGIGVAWTSTAPGGSPPCTIRIRDDHF